MRADAPDRTTPLSLRLEVISPFDETHVKRKAWTENPAPGFKLPVSVRIGIVEDDADLRAQALPDRARTQRRGHQIGGRKGFPPPPVVHGRVGHQPVSRRPMHRLAVQIPFISNVDFHTPIASPLSGWNDCFLSSLNFPRPAASPAIPREPRPPRYKRPGFPAGSAVREGIVPPGGTGPLPPGHPAPPIEPADH